MRTPNRGALHAAGGDHDKGNQGDSNDTDNDDDDDDCVDKSFDNGNGSSGALASLQTPHRPKAAAFAAELSARGASAARSRDDGDDGSCEDGAGDGKSAVQETSALGPSQRNRLYDGSSNSSSKEDFADVDDATLPLLSHADDARCKQRKRSNTKARPRAMRSDGDMDAEREEDSPASAR